MSRLKLAFILFLLPVLLPAAARAACDLQMTVSCTTTGSTSSCRATTLNAGSDACTGDIYVGFESLNGQATFSGFNSGLGLSECIDSATFPEVGFSFVMCFGSGSIAPNQSFTSTAQVAGSTSVSVLAFTAVYDPQTDEQRGLAYAFNDVNPPTCTPFIAASPISQSGVPYTVSWTAVSDPNAQFQIDESTSDTFASGTTSQTVNGLNATFQHSVTSNTSYYYRVHALSCGGSTGPFSTPTKVVVQGTPPVTSGTNVDAVVPYGSTTPVSVKIFVPAPTGPSAKADTSFNASTDKPYLTVTPSSGTIPSSGITLTVTGSPANLPPGGNTGTVSVTSSSGAPLASNAVTVSLVTPVGPGTKSTPSNNTLVIPVVTHVNGASAQFLSDVRLTNASSSQVKYQLTFTPTASDATKASRVTVVPVGASQTVALNDVAKDFFGYGATGDANDVGFGSLEIRPLDTASALTYASSRTYAVNSLGTLGQFIAAMPYSRFATNAPIAPPIGGTPAQPNNLLSFQQVAQSSSFRTNLGLVEGSGTAASGRIRVLDDLGNVLKEVPYSLLPGEHQQLNSFIANNAGIPDLQDGRIEITVDSPTGAVSGYASVLDAVTSDPLAVMPAAVSRIAATRYVLPGMADLPGDNNFHSDVRIYNGGTTSASVTPVYYPQGGGAPVAKPAFTIGAGQVKSIDNILPTLFGATSTGGSVVLTTPAPTALVATGRTYTNATFNGKLGTFGQFIPGVTPVEGIGAGDRALQVLQLEQSKNFRTNVGLAELTGNPVTVQIVATIPDSKVSPVLETTLQPNEFKQFNSILASMVGAGTNTYNARVSITVTGGTGRVTAYGSVIDNQSKDPTYVPAQ